ncbi:MAG: bifunctional phosphoribosylaminoimidazolecarboxamide formyltransferase/IMP cyclohydrolase [Balneolales bacterium]|nr:bifunctional phosphoribosylaminoimidazolecarboxamide formyltransferase/IMP cyclohydrolase [Balneolales bacterium]
MSISATTSFLRKDLSIKKALLSVFDKSELLPLAECLHKSGTELVSTGGTAAFLKSNGYAVTDIKDVTRYPEFLDGRVKTLHPAVHGGILARKNNKEDMQQLENLDITTFDLLVVNLYPFEEVRKQNAGQETSFENIDIGGPTMLRAAAKNVDHVCVLSSPDQYAEFIEQFSKTNSISFDFRMKAAFKAFDRTSAYDTAISGYLQKQISSGFPETMALRFKKSEALRYGENPHQAAAVYGQQEDFIDVLHGKQLSYNNYLDVDAALNLLKDFAYDEPSCAIIKHTLPCGVASCKTLYEAWEAAFNTDTISPFGGIVLLNKCCDLKTAASIDQIFSEIILAPDFAPDALELLKKKSNRRLIRIKNLDQLYPEYSYRSVFGGLLVQQPDHLNPVPDHFQIVTRKKPTQSELDDMLFAWKVVKRVNSNAIVFVKNRQTLGIGCGQPSRLDSSDFAVLKASKFGHSLTGSVVASDAFFPFRDGIDSAAKAGAALIIQPGGSIRDKEVIEAADEHNMSMVFTGIRHFKH